MSGWRDRPLLSSSPDADLPLSRAVRAFADPCGLLAFNGNAVYVGQARENATPEVETELSQGYL